MFKRLGLMGLVLAAACGPASLQWEIPEDSDVFRDVVLLFFFLSDAGDQRQEVAGPHAQGARIRVEVEHPRRRGRLGDITFSADEEVVGLELEERSEDDHTAWLTVRALSPGRGTIEARRPNGKVFDEVPVDVVAVADIELFALEDVRADKDDDEAGADGTLMIATGGMVDFVTTYLGDDQQVLRGDDLATVSVQEEDGVGLTATVPGALRGFDVVRVEAGLIEGETTLSVGTPVVPALRTIDVTLVDPSRLDGVGIATAPKEDGEQIVATAFAGEARVFGAPLVWAVDGVEVGRGVSSRSEGTTPHQLEVCVEDSQVCTEVTIRGSITFVDDGITGFFCDGCSGRGGAALWWPAALLGLLGLRRRR